MEHYDVAIIGGGPGGYVAAIRAAQLGKHVVLIEKEHLGGTCLNFGCIPTKSLLKSAEIFQTIKHAKNYGIQVGEPICDIKQIVARSRNIAATLSKGIKILLKKNKIVIIEGYARLAGNKLIEIDIANRKSFVKATDIIIASGARPLVLPNFQPDGKQIITSKEAMMPDILPKSMIIIGSGAIGIEFASFYNCLGVDVTIIEAKERILPIEDEEISIMARKIFEQNGIRIHTKVKALSHVKMQDHVLVDIELEGIVQTIKAEKLLIAAGIVANSKHLGLETTKIQLDHGHIITNHYMQTVESNIYAIGDVASAPYLAHKASHEAIVAIETICGLKPHIMNRNNIPSCIYSLPQIASVGLTESAALKNGFSIKVGKFPFIANGKALVIGEGEGMIKTIFDEKTGELLGAHMIGAEVTELIQGYAIGKHMECTELDLMNIIFPHPTLSEMMHESVLNAYMKSIHI